MKKITTKHSGHHIYKSNLINMLITVFTRLILICIGSYFVQIISCTQSLKFYSLFLLTLIIILDTVYVCFKRSGIDHGWFSPTYLAFSLQIILTLRMGTQKLHELDNIACKNYNLTIGIIKKFKIGPDCGMVCEIKLFVFFF